MAEITDQWLWFVDDELVEQLARASETRSGESLAARARPAEESATGVALRLHTSGKTAEAFDVLGRAIEKGEGLQDLYALQGHFRIETQDYEGAAASYRNLATLDSNHRTAWHNLGVALEKLGQHAAALEAFEKCHAVNPRLWQSLLGVGICCLYLDRAEEALEAFQVCLQQQPQSDKGAFGKAVALQLLGRLDESQEVYRRILPNNANNPELLGNLVALSSERKDSARLREYADRLLKLRPQSRVALEGLVAASLARNDYKSAAQYCSQLVKATPDSFEAWYNFGFAAHKLSRIEQAAQAYEKATHLKEDASAFANLGAVLESKGDHDGARRASEKAIELSPSSPGPLWNLALLYDKQGDVEGAELALEQLIELKPDSAEAWFRLGSKRFARTDYASAGEAFEKCLQQRSDWPEASLNSGLARLKAGDAAGARERLEAAAAAGIAEAWKALGWISVTAGDGPSTVHYYQKASEAGSRSAELAYNAGVVLQTSGDHQGAARCFAEAVEQRPDFGEALLNLGHSLDAMGNTEDARHCWAKALESRPDLAAQYFN